MTRVELKQARARLGFTQEELAAKLDVTRQSVTRWEAGTYKISRILTLAIKELERAHYSEHDDVSATTTFVEGDARKAQTQSPHANDVELQRILWACLTYWNSRPNPLDDSAFCYSWVVRCYEAKFAKTFHHSTLRRLARLGFLTHDKSTRCGTRRYYRITAPVQLADFLNGCSFETAPSVENYSTDIAGVASDGSLHLNQRITTR